MFRNRTSTINHYAAALFLVLLLGLLSAYQIRATEAAKDLPQKHNPLQGFVL